MEECMAGILEEIKKRMVFFDGGTGSLLQACGLEPENFRKHGMLSIRILLQSFTGIIWKQELIS